MRPPDCIAGGPPRDGHARAEIPSPTTYRRSTRVRSDLAFLHHLRNLHQSNPGDQMITIGATAALGGESATRSIVRVCSWKSRVAPRYARGGRASNPRRRSPFAERRAFRIRMCSAERQLSVPGAPNIPMIREVRVTSSFIMRSSTWLPAISASMTWKWPEQPDRTPPVVLDMCTGLGAEMLLQTADVRPGRPRGGSAHNARLNRAARLEDIARCPGVGRETKAPRWHAGPRCRGLRAAEGSPHPGAADAEGLAERRLGQLRSRWQPLFDNRIVNATNDLAFGRRDRLVGL